MAREAKFIAVGVLRNSCRSSRLTEDLGKGLFAGRRIEGQASPACADEVDSGSGIHSSMDEIVRKNFVEGFFRAFKEVFLRSGERVRRRPSELRRIGAKKPALSALITPPCSAHRATLHDVVIQRSAPDAGMFWTASDTSYLAFFRPKLTVFGEGVS